MLPIPVLDDENFSEIVNNARSMIPRLSPNWTDFNSHDPGITFLELFAFLKESQQYHLDQIGPRNRNKYLKLLGVEPEERAGAETTVMVEGGGGHCLPAGTRLMAGDIPFETCYTLPLSESRLTGGFAWDTQRKSKFTAGADARAGKLRLEVFGHEAKADSMWYLSFDGPWTVGQPVHLRLWLKEDWPVRRNAVGSEAFTPLTEVEWEYLGADGWKPLTVLKDETCGLLFGGMVSLKADGALCTPVGGDELLEGLEDAYWIRARLTRAGYDVPPILMGISDQAVPVIQQETDAVCLVLDVQNGRLEDDGLLSAAGRYEVYLAQEDGTWRPAECTRENLESSSVFTLTEADGEKALLLAWREEFSPYRQLAVGDGFPNQTYELPGSGQRSGRFALLAEETDRSDVWMLWEQVADFDSSGPEDRHYILDEETGTVTFGDCIHGLAPEGRILIAGHCVTLGSGGNIKAGRLTAVDPQLEELLPFVREIELTNPDDAFGGRDREDEEACFRRLRRQMSQNDRAVTYEDYESLVRRTPGLMISNCKAIPVDRLPRRDGSYEENCVTVVVEPYSTEKERVLTPAYRDNILRYLDGRRMLGTKVSLLAPEYIGITIYVEILSHPQYLDAKERIQAALASFFDNGWEFGDPVQYSRLYGIIDTMACVQRIESLTIDAQGRGISRGINGDVVLPHNGLAVLRAVSCQVRPGE